MLKDLLAGIEETPQEFGRPKISNKGLLFSSALKVYTQFSLRRFQSDLNFAKEKGFVERTACFASVGHFMQDKTLTPILHKLIAESSTPLKTVESSFAIDSTGFKTTQFSEYCKDKHKTTQKHQWVKLHACVGVKTNTICSVIIGDEHHSPDSPQFAPLIRETASNGFKVETVYADMAYSSRENYETVASLKGKAYIPFRKNATGTANGSLLWRKMFSFFAFYQEEFMQIYHARSNVETTFSMIKKKFNDTLKSKSKTAQVNELLLKVLCHNIVVLIHESNELGIQTRF